MAEKNTATIGFEKQIWDAACVLRGNMDASEYKNVVLGLIFLKYISDRFEDKYQELVAEGEGFEEDIDEYTSEGIFFVPQEARWSEIAKAAHTPELGTVIDNLTLLDMKTGKELDMGSPFDLFSEASHPDYRGITEEQHDNRMLLQRVMVRNGFAPINCEWWHFALQDEPYPETYFNFPVSAAYLRR